MLQLASFRMWVAILASDKRLGFLFSATLGDSTGLGLITPAATAGHTDASLAAAVAGVADGLAPAIANKVLADQSSYGPTSGASDRDAHLEQRSTRVRYARVALGLRRATDTGQRTTGADSYRLLQHPHGVYQPAQHPLLSQAMSNNDPDAKRILHME
ncbi:hypothetical protein RhiJN_23897 [Ceratobasidium sp. AG-Ba]|nr:hypothetical protein RhiJN_23897 [Ceratobasidium sp. AG-Ba]